MEYGEVLRKRQSSREYIPKDVKREHIAKMIEAASMAPSSGNLQNWLFIVVREKLMREKIMLSCLRQTWMMQAPVFIVVCNRKTQVLDLYPKRGGLYSVQNCACATNNLMLKAAELGLSTCWVGAFNENHMRKILDIPEDVVPEMIVTVGYSNEKNIKERQPLENIVYFDRYGKRCEPESVPVGDRVGNVVEEVKEKSKIGRLKGLFKIN